MPSLTVYLNTKAVELLPLSYVAVEPLDNVSVVVPVFVLVVILVTTVIGVMVVLVVFCCVWCSCCWSRCS